MADHTRDGQDVRRLRPGGQPRVKGKWVHIEASRKGFCPVCRETVEVGDWISKFVPLGKAWRHRRCIGKTAQDMPWSTSGSTPEPMVERMMERVDKHTFTGFCEVCQVQLWQGESGMCRSCRTDRFSRKWHDRDEE